MSGGNGHQDGVPALPSNLNPVINMKIKTLALAALGIVGWSLSITDASAFGRHRRNYSVIMCRPYNAFTPICWGKMVCDGCCPTMCGGGGCGPIQQHMPMSMGCGEGGHMPGPLAFAGPIMQPQAAPAPQGAPMPVAPAPYAPPNPMPMPMPMAPSFTAPPPTPAPGINQTSMPWNYYAPYGVQPAGYYPGYYPMNHYPVSQPMVPSYWYGR